MNETLTHLITQFREGTTIAPVLVSRADATQVLNTLFEKDHENLEDYMETVVQDLCIYDFRDEDGKIGESRGIIERASRTAAGAFQVFVLIDIEKLTEQAANSLLKTFEDVPKGTLFLVTSSHHGSILKTLFSRITHISHDDQMINLDPEIQEDIDAFFRGDTTTFVRRLLDAKIEKDQYIAVLMYLQKLVKQGIIKDESIIRKILEITEIVFTSNAQPKYQLDSLFLDLVGKHS